MWLWLLVCRGRGEMDAAERLHPPAGEGGGGVEMDSGGRLPATIERGQRGEGRWRPPCVEVVAEDIQRLGAGELPERREEMLGAPRQRREARRVEAIAPERDQERPAIPRRRGGEGRSIVERGEGGRHVGDGDRTIATLTPAKRVYPTEQQETAETAIRTTGVSDLYLALGDERGKGRFIVRAYYNPLAPFIWFGGAIMAMGGCASLWGRVRARSVRNAIEAVPAE